MARKHKDNSADSVRVDINPEDITQAAATALAAIKSDDDGAATADRKAVRAVAWAEPIAKDAWEWLRPRVDKAWTDSVQAAAPHVEHLAHKAAPLLSGAHERLVPAAEAAGVKAGESITAAHAKLADEFLPRIVHLVNEAAERKSKEAAHAVALATEVSDKAAKHARKLRHAEAELAEHAERLERHATKAGRHARRAAEAAAEHAAHDAHHLRRDAKHALKHAAHDAAHEAACHGHKAGRHAARHAAHEAACCAAEHAAGRDALRAARHGRKAAVVVAEAVAEPEKRHCHKGKLVALLALAAAAAAYHYWRQAQPQHDPWAEPFDESEKAEYHQVAGDAAERIGAAAGTAVAYGRDAGAKIGEWTREGVDRVRSRHASTDDDVEELLVVRDTFLDDTAGDPVTVKERSHLRATVDRIVGEARAKVGPETHKLVDEAKVKAEAESHKLAETVRVKVEAEGHKLAEDAKRLSGEAKVAAEAEAKKLLAEAKVKGEAEGRKLVAEVTTKAEAEVKKLVAAGKAAHARHEAEKSVVDEVVVEAVEPVEVVEPVTLVEDTNH